MTRSGGRLDPPMVVVLDEAANICRIADLPELYSHLGSRGMVPVITPQPAQLSAADFPAAMTADVLQAATSPPVQPSGSSAAILPARTRAYSPAGPSAWRPGNDRAPRILAAVAAHRSVHQVLHRLATLLSRNENAALCPRARPIGPTEPSLAGSGPPSGPCHPP